MEERDQRMEKRHEERNNLLKELISTLQKKYVCILVHISFVNHTDTHTHTHIAIFYKYFNKV